jgi:hypothetical protein
MAKLRANHFNEALLLIAVCAVSATLGFVLRSNKVASAKAYSPALLRQSDDKIIEINERPDELLEFSNLRVKNVKVAPGQRFSAQSIAANSNGQAEDWLENLEFRLENRSDKQIIYILFELQFPDTEINGPLMVYGDWGIGIPPRQSGNSVRSNGQSLALNPGATTTVALSDQTLQRIKQFIGLRNFQLTNIQKVVVKILYVLFDDGLKWSTGRYYKLNPSLPGGYERIN